MLLTVLLTLAWGVASSVLNVQKLRLSKVEVFERLHSIPAGWVQEGPAPAYQPILFRIALHPEQPDAGFEQQIIDISTPGHPLYGQHLEYDELKAFVQPSSDVSVQIKSWLVAQGIREASIEDDGDWFNFVAPVEAAERILHTRFHVFRHQETGVRAVRTLQYALPAPLHRYIQMVQPTTHFGRPKPHLRDAVAQAGGGGGDGGDGPSNDEDEPVPKFGSATKLNATYCSETVSTDCLRALYEIGDFRANATSGARLGISGFAESHVDYSDVALFVDKWAPFATGANFSVVSINGGNNTQNDTQNIGTEASMDVQLGLALSYNTPVTFYTTGGRGPLVPDLQQPSVEHTVQEPWLEHLLFLVKLPRRDLPNVLSVSYGEDEQSLPASYTRVVCRLFAQLAARGVSVITSSGDGGPGDGCMTNDGTNTTRFMPQFPSSCPWVTSVGGTYGVQPEKAVVLSGGGFSERFARPAWQEAAVDQYLARIGDTFQDLFNHAGRGIPDVSAQAWINHPIFYRGREIMSGGTSASAPTFAAVIANLNSLRMARGQRPLGFLNPWLYGSGRAGLTDIVSGGSRGCFDTTFAGTPAPEVAGAGFNATVGWDPVTGLGTPLFSKLRTLMD